MANQSTKMISRVGGESQLVALFGNVFNSLVNAQPNANAQDVANVILNSYGGVIKQLSPAQYEQILAIFSSAGMSDQISKAYALLCIDALKTLDITLDDLFEQNDDAIKFSNLGLTLMNHYRPITSQIGTTVTVSQTPNHIKREIAY
tara:strand:+ start:202 stop:642 length:441 start_codon:yes stop_codon:yes gene_type:complete